MTSVLVSGGNGFVGRHTVPILAEQYHEVHVLTTSAVPAQQIKNVYYHSYNFLEDTHIEDLVKQISPSHLLHLAWYTKPPEYWISSLNLCWLNKSLELLQAFINAKGKRAVIIGTCAEYNWRFGDCHEFTTPCNPTTLYGSAKYALCTLSQVLAKQNNLSLAWARLFYLFGPYEQHERLIPTAILKLMQKQTFEIKNDYHIRDYLYVEDVSSALVKLLNSSVLGPVNIASGQALTIGQLITIISRELQAEHLVKVASNQDFIDKADVAVTANVKRLQQEVQWTASYEINSALMKTIAWWRGKF